MGVPSKLIWLLLFLDGPILYWSFDTFNLTLREGIYAQTHIDPRVPGQVYISLVLQKIVRTRHVSTYISYENLFLKK